MPKRKIEWHAILPGGKAPAACSLEELRAAREVHAFLTEPIDAPDGIADFVLAFRLLLFFGVGCVAEDKYPALTRCWKDLDRRFMSDPAFLEPVFVQAWILMDFPFGPGGRTVVDCFEEFLAGTEAGAQVRPFIASARASRLGLHQDVLRTRKVARFRELVTGNVIDVLPTVEEYTKGEILLSRAVSYDGKTFFLGDPAGFPREAKRKIERMVLDKLIFLREPGEKRSIPEQCDRFMRLAGPYWMSCITKNEDAPILDPDRYLSYLLPDRI
jgi:hypothetical protein